MEDARPIIITALPDIWSTLTRVDDASGVDSFTYCDQTATIDGNSDLVTATIDQPRVAIADPTAPSITNLALCKAAAACGHLLVETLQGLRRLDHLLGIFDPLSVKRTANHLGWWRQGPVNLRSMRVQPINQRRAEVALHLIENPRHHVAAFGIIGHPGAWRAEGLCIK
ncbi:MAG: Rv3235 family protein [Propionibacteriaceae bacterium]|jgi:hypothetical protein|nr:Rv3235 family protein [Propionibacteriaceae bacterium]